MKKLAISMALFFIVVVSCKKLGLYTPSYSGTAKSFTVDVSPIVVSNCAANGCHGVGSKEGPGALTTFTQISNNRAQIRSAIVNGSMPQGSTLYTAQKNDIVCWIDAGAFNN